MDPRRIDSGTCRHVFDGAVHALRLPVEPRWNIGNSTREFYLFRFLGVSICSICLTKIGLSFGRAEFEGFLEFLVPATYKLTM
jgi:hypothetical protein